MNYDEFGFFNQQLAAMLRDGIPLEGALKQLCAGMRSGPLRAEIERLEADLAKGTPLKDALAKRSLPEFYVKMLQLGVRSNDLPGVLTMLADHYQRANAVWTRLKGLMVYPALVIVVALGLTLLLSVTASRMQSNFMGDLGAIAHQDPNSSFLMASVWMPPLFLAAVALGAVVALSVPSFRSWLRWRLPAFREASLAQLASAMVLMLKNGTTLVEALALAEALEATTPAGRALAHWRSLAEAGKGKAAHWSSAGTPFPPLFIWLVQRSGEDIAAGFQKAAEIFRARADYRIELALYAALPISILLLGQMVLWQATPLFRAMIWMLNMFGDMGGGGGHD